MLDAHLAFTDDPGEWIGTTITFDIARKGDRTEVRFRHEGLVPEVECYDKCSSAWAFYVNTSLRELIATGQGHPNPIDDHTAV